MFTNNQGDGATLTYASSTGIFTYTERDGTVATFGHVDPAALYDAYNIISVQYPAGQQLNYYYADVVNTAAGANYHTAILQDITSSLGYQLRLSHTLSGGINYITKSVAFNMTDETCDPTAASCTLSGSWPTVTWDISTGTYIDSLGRQTKDTSTSSSEVITYPTGRTVTYGGASHNAPNGVPYFRISSFSDGVASWRYQNPSPYALVTLVYGPTDPAPWTYQFNSNGAISLEQPPTDSGAPDKEWSYDSNGRVTAYKVAPTNNGGTASEIDYSYDSRGNVTESRQISTAPGTPADIVQTAHFPTNCTNVKTCNNPDYAIDSNGNRADYSYAPTTGQLTVETDPAPVTNGARPTTVYSYTNYEAYYRNASGSIVASGEPVSLLSGISTCSSGATCAGSSAETKTTISYGPQMTGVANNLLPVSESVAAGNGSVNATTSYTYTPDGDVQTVDGPLSGSTDTTKTYYDVMRRATGIIGPDPDGSGSLLMRAERITYDGENEITDLEVGTATNQGDSGMSSFVSLQQDSSTYNAQGHKATETISAGGTKMLLMQYSYTSDGALQCTAQRMNTAAFSSMPASACTLGTQGSYGPDRITEIAHDNAMRVTSITSGVGTADQGVEVAKTYDPWGRVSTETDGNTNTTTYLYDGMGRLSKTEYPSPTKGAGTSSTTDYEQLGYDPYGNITSRRLRDGTSIGYTYDHLNRLTNKNLSGSEPDVTYGYDLLGRPTSVSQSGNALSFTYDALGRLLTETGPEGTLTSTWDASGRRTELQWPDGFYVNYDYDTLGEMTKVRENGATSGVGVLASYTYDNLGNRIGATYGNGTTSTWTPDAMSRLSSLVQNLAGTVYDLTKSFTYNPANQIASVTSSNDAYAWNAAANVNRNYTTNGLNQYAVSGGVSLGYDARGNLTTSGSNSYTYSSENLMKTGPGSTTLTYDPLLRLYQVTQGSTTTRFAYDGLEMVAEYNASNALQKRYVFGPGTDEPIVQYTGTGTTSRNWLMTDERGSVIALTDSAGSEVAINSYDEYGIPGSANSGRFQYTGQEWLPEIGMYYYKARLYSPSLGRFMQTDPIGYANGLNWYNYVGSDPINFADPLGMQSCQPDAGNSQQGDAGTGQCSDPNPASDIDVNGYRCPQGGCEAYRDQQANQEEQAYQQHEQGDVPQILQRNGQKPPSHDEGDPDYNRDLNKCRALADSGNRAAARRCYGSAERRKEERDSGVPEVDLPPLILWRVPASHVRSGSSTVLVVGGTLAVGGVICALVEPCGAFVAGSLAIGGTATLATAP